MLKLITPPASEPVSLAEAKLYLKIDDTFDDTLISSLITAARKKIEAELGIQIITATWELHLDNWCNPVFLMPPLASITSVSYNDLNDNLQVVSASNYYADTVSKPGRLQFIDSFSFPQLKSRPNPIVIRFVSGASSGSETLQTALKLMLAHLYENRGNETVEMPMAIKYLLANDDYGNYFSQSF